LVIRNGPRVTGGTASRLSAVEKRGQVIRLEALQLRRLAADALRQLKVEDTAEVVEVSELTDGTWMVDFEDRSPDTRFPGFAIDIQQDWSPEQAIRELRVELRNKLWICPLCQRRSQIRRIIDREVFRVECDRCGRFEIEQLLLGYFRLAYEDHGEDVAEQLPRLAAVVGRAGGGAFLSAENWRALAGEAAG
jgi:hypothetical protein